jgi:hypothetical protein
VVTLDTALSKAEQTAETSVVIVSPSLNERGFVFNSRLKFAY